MGNLHSRRARLALRLAAACAVGVGFRSTSLYAEDRSIDGSGNNTATFSLGQAGTIYIREASGAHYADGVASPNGGGRPDARTISNLLMNQGESAVADARGLTAMIYTWGQFIDHDLNLRSDASPHESLHIHVPSTDQQFDPAGSGTQIIPMFRSAFDPLSGTSASNPRQQINHVTSYLDASMVYGSDAARASWLRAGSGGRLKSVATPTGATLPMNDGSQVMDGLTGPSTSGTLFVAGDGRANEQIGITSLQTLLLREHNRQATLLSRQNPGWSDEQVYQHARAIVSGEIQSITYNQFLPALLGGSAIPAYAGYSASTDPSASNAFAAVAFRVGHSMLDDDIERVGPDGNTIAAGNLPLRDAFFNPAALAANGGIDPVLRGVTTRIQQAVDLGMVEDIRSFLFGAPGAGGLDLAALDIQRGRDHGLADYNTMRQDFGLAKVTTFAQITSDPAIQAQLQAVYGSVNNIDPFVGCLAEDHLAGSSVGPLTSAIIADQFRRTRDGDRFFYLNDPNLSASEVSAIGGFTLADLIRRNTFVRNLQDNVFFAGSANLGPTWALATGASWNSAPSWAGALPNGAGAFATFQSAPSASVNVSLDAPIVIGSLQLDNSNSITIQPGAGGSLTFDNLGSSAAIIITRGSHAITAPASLVDSLTVLYQGAGSLNFNGPIAENNPGQSIIVDGSFAGPNGGGVTTLSGSNSFTGGVAVTRSLLNLNHTNAQGALGSTASASDNGELVLGFVPTASHRFSINDLGAIRGDNTQLGALTAAGNLSLASGAMIVRQTAGGTLPAGLGSGGNFYAAYTSNVSGASAAITIGASSATPFKGIGADRQSSYTWGSLSDVLTLSGDADLVSLGGSTLTVAARLSGGTGADTLTKRGSGTVRLTNATNSFAAGHVSVQGGSLQFAYGAAQNFSSNVSFSVASGGTLAFSDGSSTTISGAVINNGAIIKPSGTSTQLVFHGGALSGSGVLVAQDTQVGNSGFPNFIQTPTSTILAHAILFNNGVSNRVGGVAGLDPNASSPIIAIDGAGTSVHLTGRWDGDGPSESSWVVLTNGARLFFDAGAQLDTIADDPSKLRPFAGRGDGTGTVDFADGFVANQRDEVPGVAEFYVWSPGNMTWITHNSLNFPDSNIEVNQEDGAHWIVATHDQIADCGLTGSRSFTVETLTNLTLARAGAWALFDGTKSVTKTGSGTMTIAGENAVPSGASNRILSAVGSTLKVNGGKFITMTDMGQAATNSGANGVFGAPGLPDADDVITTRYGWNVAVNGAGSIAEFNASQHLLSLKINSGGVAKLNRFTYGNGSSATLIAQTLGTDAGSATLEFATGNSATASTNFSVGAASTFNQIGQGSLSIIGTTTFGAGAIFNVSAGTAAFNLPVAASVSVGSGAQISVQPGSTLTVNASTRDPLADLANASQRIGISNGGQFNLTAGSSKPGVIDGTGTTVVSSGASLQASHIRQGALTLVGSATAIVNQKGDETGTSRLTSLTIGGANNAWTAKLDLKDNDLVIDYPVAGTNPIATVQNQVKTARASGNWTGNGITTTLGDLYVHALGVADNNVLGLSTFSGQTLDATSILIKYTYSGDANLDGMVDVTDLGMLALHWQADTLDWTSGDFNYDGTVNVADLYMLANNWQAGISGPFPVPLASALAAFGLPPASVPEPSMIGTVAIPAMLAASIRRRRRERCNKRGEAEEKGFEPL